METHETPLASDALFHLLDMCAISPAMIVETLHVSWTLVSFWKWNKQPVSCQHLTALLALVHDRVTADAVQVFDVLDEPAQRDRIDSDLDFLRDIVEALHQLLQAHEATVSEAQVSLALQGLQETLALPTLPTPWDASTLDVLLAELRRTVTTVQYLKTLGAKREIVAAALHEEEETLRLLTTSAHAARALPEEMTSYATHDDLRQPQNEPRDLPRSLRLTQKARAEQQRLRKVRDEATYRV